MTTNEHAMPVEAGAVKWRRGDFELIGPRSRSIVKGHTNGVFGLDRRAYWNDSCTRQDWGYVITHLRTGYIVRGVKGSLATAKKAADLLMVDDWSFDTPEECKRVGPTVKKVMDQFQGVVTTSLDFDDPLVLRTKVPA